MKATHGHAALLVLILAACGKSRPFADGTAFDGGLSAGGLPIPETVASAESMPVPGEADLAPVDGFEASGANLGASGEPDMVFCDDDAGTCPGDAETSLPPPCVPTGARDCSSPRDNDCDGQLDSALDDVCRCIPGLTEACEEHPGFDGRGQCHAGSRTCVVLPGNTSSDWGPCTGSVGPQEADSCATAGDDANCDGTNNGGCPCVDGETQTCGPGTENGICQFGTQTCEQGNFGACIGAVFPAARNCSSLEDNDCDGRPDNTIDNVCTCTVGTTQACDEHPGLDGIGRCRAGQRQCVLADNAASSSFGACTGSVGPLAQDSCARGNDDDCDGVSNGNCGCIDGTTRQCGTTDTGNCTFGTETCINGNFAACQGAVDPAPQDSCAFAGDDSNCNGVPNDRCVVLLELGDTCVANTDCGSGRCDTWHADADGDGFGDPNVTARTCGTAGNGFPPDGFVASSNDCCDSVREVNPGQTQAFDLPHACPQGVLPFDYNCDGEEQSRYAVDPCSTLNINECNTLRTWAVGFGPACGGVALAQKCTVINFTCVDLVTPVGETGPSVEYEYNFCR